MLQGGRILSKPDGGVRIQMDTVMKVNWWKIRNLDGYCNEDKLEKNQLNRTMVMLWCYRVLYGEMLYLQWGWGDWCSWCCYRFCNWQSISMRLGLYKKWCNFHGTVMLNGWGQCCYGVCIRQSHPMGLELCCWWVYWWKASVHQVVGCSCGVKYSTGMLSNWDVVMCLKMVWDALLDFAIQVVIM